MFSIPHLYIHEECISPSTSSTTENQVNQVRGASFGAVGCLRYVEDFEILETLGQGFFGVVHKVVPTFKDFIKLYCSGT